MILRLMKINYLNLIEFLPTYEDFLRNHLLFQCLITLLLTILKVIKMVIASNFMLKIIMIIINLIIIINLSVKQANQ